MCWSDGYNYLAGSSDLSEVFHYIVLASNGNGRARIGQGECRARTVFKIDSELGLGLMKVIFYGVSP